MRKIPFQLRINSKTFRSDETGTVTVEFVLWLPILLILISLVADASMIFYGKAHALRIVQDGNRSYSVGRLSNDTNTERYIRERLLSLSDKAAVETRTNSSGVITTIAQFPASDLVAVGLLTQLTGFNVFVQSQHLKEYPG